MQRVVERTRSLKTLLEKGADALLPKKVGDLWHKPEVSAKLAARARKILLAEGKCVLPLSRHCSQWKFCRSSP